MIEDNIQMDQPILVAVEWVDPENINQDSKSKDESDDNRDTIER